ncbi:MAG TPA: cysteine hydrolase [Burkholderiales bacterium]|jgi:ureidoacrylate peracid hydrolase
MNFGVDQARAAIVAIDLHRGHLDLSVATMPATPDVAQRVLGANRGLFDWARTQAVPVIHLVTRYRDAEEIRLNAFWRTRAEDPNATRKNVMRHNIIGMPGCEIMPGLFQQGDWVVDTKKRYNCFVATDLELLLRAHGINTLVVTGVNTNSCVLSTVTAACSMDYAVIVPSDCVDTMDKPELHDAALLCIRTAFGFVMTSQEVMALPELKKR